MRLCADGSSTASSPLKAANRSHRCLRVATRRLAPAEVHTAAAWFNPFLAPVNSFGNAGRNSLVGPKFVNADLSLFRTIHLAERWNLEARGEVFNAWNHPNLRFPNNMLGSMSGGQNFGQILSVVGNPRQIQFALKLLF
jgi:hypothetical protein